MFSKIHRPVHKNGSAAEKGSRSQAEASVDLHLCEGLVAVQGAGYLLAMPEKLMDAQGTGGGRAWVLGSLSEGSGGLDFRSRPLVGVLAQSARLQLVGGHASLDRKLGLQVRHGLLVHHAAGAD